MGGAYISSQNGIRRTCCKHPHRVLREGDFKRRVTFIRMPHALYFTRLVVLETTGIGVIVNEGNTICAQPREVARDGKPLP